MNTDDTTQQVQDGAEDQQQQVQDGSEQQKPSETAVDAFSRGVEEARAAEGGTTKPQDESAATDATEAKGATDKPTDKAKPDAEQTPEQKAEAERKAALDAEIKDLGLKEKKAERFRTLEAGYREAIALKKEIEPLRAKAKELDQMHAVLVDTKARPEQVGNMFRLLKLSNSGDVVQMRAALKDIQAYAVELAKACGETVSAYSPLDGHPDLQQKVAEGALTQEAAQEIIRSRATEASNNAARDQREQERRQQEADEREHNQAVNDLNAMGRDLSASDPHYAHKIAQMQEVPPNGKSMMDMVRDAPKAQWAQRFRDFYALLKAPAKKPPVSDMPLRPNGASAGGGGMARTPPKKPEDAFAFGVALAKEQGV